MSRFNYSQKDFLEYCKGDLDKWHPFYFSKCQSSLQAKGIEVFWSIIKKKYLVFDSNTAKVSEPKIKDLRLIMGKLYLHYLE